MAKSTEAESSVPGDKVLQWTETEGTTNLKPMVAERMARAKTMSVHIGNMIDKIRFAAQTNPLFRGDRLVASALNMVSDRQQYAVALKDAAVACFDNIKPLCDHSGEMANAMASIAQFQDVYLRQVQIFGVKPLKDYLSYHYPRLLAEYTELEKRRDKYDMARAKKMVGLERQALLEQAVLMETLLMAINDHQMAFCKCVDTLVRGEAQLFKESKGVIDAVRAPDHKKRWTA